MDYVTLLNVTNGSEAGYGVLCGSAPVVTTRNNRGIVGSGVFCESVQRIYLENRNTAR
jgi:hypothetical protein